jgi:hypothetical protein
MSEIVVRIPVELTQAMILRGGVIKDEARALELAVELHETVAEVMNLHRADRPRLVEFPNGDYNAEPVVLEERHEPTALEIAEFTLESWRRALPFNEEEEDGGWISVELAGLCGDDLYRRWLTIGDHAIGSDVASTLDFDFASTPMERGPR